MSNTIKTLYGTPTPITFTSLLGLAGTTTLGTGAASAYVDNSTNLFTRIRIVMAFCTTTGSPANDKCIYVFLVPILSDPNGNYQAVSQLGVPTGTDAAVSGSFESLLLPIKTVPLATALNVVKVSALIALPPGRWAVFVRNTTGLSLTAAAITRANSTAYALGAVAYVSANGHYYLCTTAGTSSGSTPTWPTDGSTVTDGTVVWKDVGTMLPNSMYYIGEYDQVV